MSVRVRPRSYHFFFLLQLICPILHFHIQTRPSFPVLCSLELNIILTRTRLPLTLEFLLILACERIRNPREGAFMVILTRSWEIFFTIFIRCLLLPSIWGSIFTHDRTLLDAIITWTRGNILTQYSNRSIHFHFVDYFFICPTLVFFKASVTHEYLKKLLTDHQIFLIQFSCHKLQVQVLTFAKDRWFLKG